MTYRSHIVSLRQTGFATQKPSNRGTGLVAPEELRNTNSKNPWVAVKDPKAQTALVYYWNQQTGETTALGAPKPRHWVEVKDPNGSALTYFWDPETNEVTALGAPKPGSIQAGSNVHQSVVFPRFQQQQVPTTFGGTMKLYFGLGVGMSIGMMLVRAILG